MKTKNVIVIGAGIAGCAAALAVAKRGIPVTIMTSSLDQRMYHANFIKMENLEEKLKEVKNSYRSMSCSRAMEQLLNMAKTSLEELVEPHLLVDRDGNIDLYKGLQEQLKLIPHVEWANQHLAVELLTLDNHSTKKSDIYKKPSCLGVYAYNYETQEIDTILAKETILATGGAASLFPYSTHTHSARGSGLAMAHRAGARLLNLEDTFFHPIALFDQDKPCIPLPLDLLKEGGKLHTSKNLPLEGLVFDHTLSKQLYDELSKNYAAHLWLDLTKLDPLYIKDKYPSVDTWCHHYGFNIVKDLIPVVPVAQYTGGGVAVDRVGQTNIQRLRALGEVACTGLTPEFYDEAMGVLESLTYAVSIAEDIAKQIPKFIYYFPEVREWKHPIQHETTIIQEDWHFLREIMWHYVGIGRDIKRLKRGYSLLKQLKSDNEMEHASTFSIDRMHLQNALEMSLLITKAAMDTQ